MIWRAGMALFGVVLWTCGALAGEREDWSRIEALDAGPQTKFTSREQAGQVALQHLSRQEKAIRSFLARYPGSPKSIDARLRLARIYMVRGDLSGDRELITRAFATLDELAKDPATPADRRDDVAFARISLEMRRAQRDLKGSRDSLRLQAEVFASTYPGDHRIAPLFAEIAGVYDDAPAVKEKLLERAAANAKDEGLKRQIADDQKRLRMLGKPLELEFKAMDGKPVDLEAMRGRVVVICFFADWSPPSMITLAKVEELTRKYPPQQVRVVGISLDSDMGTARAVKAKFGIDWPVYCDGKGWHGRFVRSLGINALPTVWIVDRRGVLRVLNEPDDPERVVRSLIGER